MEIIWTKQELGKIKKIILTRANLTVDENNEIVVNDFSVEYEMYTQKSKGAYYSVDKELKEIFYIKNRSEIQKILDMASGVSFNPNDAMHLGLISALSRIDTNDHTQIFIILREIASQFEKVAAQTALAIRSYANTTEEFKTEIAKFKNSQETTIEEMLANSKLHLILNSTNGVANHEMFSNLIERYTNNMKHLIIVHLEMMLAHEVKNNIRKEKFNIADYQKERSDRYVRERKGKIGTIFKRS